MWKSVLVALLVLIPVSFAHAQIPTRNVSMEMRHRFDLISVEMQPPFGLNSRLQVD